MNKPDTVASALSFASSYWEQNEQTNTRRRGRHNAMVARASLCAQLLGLSRKLHSLGPQDGASLLTSLRQKGGLSRSSVATYYAAGKRMIELAGGSTRAWPKAPTPPRKIPKQAISAQDIDTLLSDLEAKGWHDTADLVRLMRDTGLRVEVEALRGDWEVSQQGNRLRVLSGKGGHGREIPYSGPERGPLEGITYEGHLRRIKAVGSPIRPHDLRRYFIEQTYHRTGKDLRLAQVLAGHASPSTTAGYIGIDWENLLTLA